MIKVVNASKVVGKKSRQQVILHPINLNIEQGEFLAIVGRSGSGKTTLLNLLTGLDKPSAGSVSVYGTEISKIGGRKLSDYRGKIGIIFQSYNLLANLNVVENVLSASWLGGKKEDKERAIKLLTDFDLQHRINAKISTLSGGEKQRVAIARCLMNDPDIIFCDEPTGALDSKNETQVIQILRDLNKISKKTVVIITHNPAIARQADRIIELSDGKIINNQ